MMRMALAWVWENQTSPHSSEGLPMKVTPTPHSAPVPLAGLPPEAVPARKPAEPAAEPAPTPEGARPSDQAHFSRFPMPDLGPQSLIDRVREALAKRPYESPALPDLTAAIAWDPGAKGLSGSQANATINRTYHHLSGAFDRYLGEPALPNWMTFGQYASREAGTQIDALEDAFSALHAVRHSRDPRDIYRALDEAMEHLSPDLAKQVLKLTRSQIDLPSIKELLGGGLHPAVGVSGEVFSLVGDTMAAVERLHTALVRGNVGIYSNMAPAYDHFLKAETQGQDGLEALRENGYAPGGEHDPQGFLHEAFTRYQAARKLGEQAKNAPIHERAMLLEERQALIHEANLFIGIQEQMVILQAPEIYGDPEVAHLVNSQGELSLTDPTGTHRLVGGWADFATRMGFDAVPAGTSGAIAIRDHAGRTGHFLIPDPPPDGTIAAYFQAGLTPETARRLLAGTPRPL